MIVNTLQELEINNISWSEYDVIFMASGFEARSTHLLGYIPPENYGKCVVLGFEDGHNLLSRPTNDLTYINAGLTPFKNSDPLMYEDFLKRKLHQASLAAGERTLKIFVDYSVMTRVWYAYILTWIKYSGDTVATDVVLSYTHGNYEGKFQDFQIIDANSMAGFEGVSAGSRRTAVLYGLGYDKFATLAVHELMQPDRFFCFVATDIGNDAPAQHVIRENSQIIEASGQKPLILPLCDIAEVVRSLSDRIEKTPMMDEVIAVPMGPKTHVLGVLLAGHKIPRLTCMHPRGRRDNPVQVIAHGRISCWLVQYRMA